MAEPPNIESSDDEVSEEMRGFAPDSRRLDMYGTKVGAGIFRHTVLGAAAAKSRADDRDQLATDVSDFIRSVISGAAASAANVHSPSRVPVGSATVQQRDNAPSWLTRLKAEQRLCELDENERRRQVTEELARARSGKRVEPLVEEETSGEEPNVEALVTGTSAVPTRPAYEPTVDEVPDAGSDSVAAMMRDLRNLELEIAQKEREWDAHVLSDAAAAQATPGDVSHHPAGHNDETAPRSTQPALGVTVGFVKGVNGAHQSVPVSDQPSAVAHSDVSSRAVAAVTAATQGEPQRPTLTASAAARVQTVAQAPQLETNAPVVLPQPVPVALGGKPALKPRAGSGQCSRDPQISVARVPVDATASRQPAALSVGPGAQASSSTMIDPPASTVASRVVSLDVVSRGAEPSTDAVLAALRRLKGVMSEAMGAVAAPAIGRIENPTYGPGTSIRAQWNADVASRYHHQQSAQLSDRPERNDHGDSRTATTAVPVPRASSVMPSRLPTQQARDLATAGDDADAAVLRALQSPLAPHGLPPLSRPITIADGGLGCPVDQLHDVSASTAPIPEGMGPTHAEEAGAPRQISASSQPRFMSATASWDSHVHSDPVHLKPATSARDDRATSPARFSFTSSAFAPRGASPKPASRLTPRGSGLVSSPPIPEPTTRARDASGPSVHARIGATSVQPTQHPKPALLRLNIRRTPPRLHSNLKSHLVSSTAPRRLEIVSGGRGVATPAEGGSRRSPAPQNADAGGAIAMQAVEVEDPVTLFNRHLSQFERRQADDATKASPNHFDVRSEEAALRNTLRKIEEL